MMQITRRNPDQVGEPMTIEIPCKKYLPALCSLLEKGHSTNQGVSVSLKFPRRLYASCNGKEFVTISAGAEPIYVEHGGDTLVIKEIMMTEKEVVEFFRSGVSVLWGLLGCYFDGSLRILQAEWHEDRIRITTSPRSSNLRARRPGKDAIVTHIDIFPDGHGRVEIDGFPDQELRCV